MRLKLVAVGTLEVQVDMIPNSVDLITSSVDSVESMRLLVVELENGNLQGGTVASTGKPQANAAVMVNDKCIA